MHTRAFAVIFTVAAMLAGCTLTRGSSYIVGKVRSPVEVSAVKVYTSPPKAYEKIALVSAEGRNDFATMQNLSENALRRLKEEAAEVGANGLILEGFGRESKGTAIFVTEE